MLYHKGRSDQRPFSEAARLPLVMVFAAALCPALAAHDEASTGGFVVHFIRGDVNVDGDLDISDPIGTLLALFAGRGPLACEKAADFDDSGLVEVADVIATLTYMFLRGAPPEAPFPACGDDETEDVLTCGDAPPCEWSSVVASYGILETVAGRGFFRGKDFNGWSEEFELAPAVDAELSRPHMTQADEAGTLYVADKDADAIRAISPEGIIRTIAGTGVAGDGSDEPGPGTERALDGPNGLWVTDDGVVFILDTGNGKVRRLDTDGTLSTLFEDSEGILVGRGLWVNDEATLAYYCSTSVIKRWTSDAGIAVFSQGYVELGTLHVVPDGTLLAADRNAHRVYRVDATGERTPVAGNGEAGFGVDGASALQTPLWGVRAVWPHPLGGLLLATHEGSQIWYVDRAGVAHLFLDGRDNHSHTGDGEHFRAPGFKISEPRAVVLDHDGNVIVTENDFGFIRRVRRVETSASK